MRSSPETSRSNAQRSKILGIKDVKDVIRPSFRSSAKDSPERPKGAKDLALTREE